MLIDRPRRCRIFLQFSVLCELQDCFSTLPIFSFRWYSLYRWESCKPLMLTISITTDPSAKADHRADIPRLWILFMVLGKQGEVGPVLKELTVLWRQAEGQSQEFRARCRGGCMGCGLEGCVPERLLCANPFRADFLARGEQPPSGPRWQILSKR